MQRFYIVEVLAKRLFMISALTYAVMSHISVRASRPLNIIALYAVISASRASDVSFL